MPYPRRRIALIDFLDYDAESIHQEHHVDVACDVAGLYIGLLLSRNDEREKEISHPSIPVLGFSASVGYLKVANQCACFTAYSIYLWKGCALSTPLDMTEKQITHCVGYTHAPRLSQAHRQDRRPGSTGQDCSRSTVC